VNDYDHDKDVLMDAKGTVAEVEGKIAFDSLLPDVQAGICAKTGAAKILKVESVTRSGRLTSRSPSGKQQRKARDTVSPSFQSDVSLF
jgi:hypothetical protein